MKPTSVIFLVVSVLLIIGGMITCSVAKDIAITDSYTLFSDTENGGTYTRHDFDSAEINKIELLVTDAEINVYGGAEQSYIEFYNFRDGMHTISTAGKTISLDELPDLKSLFNFSSGFSFSGLRYFLRSDAQELGPKKINIYLDTGASLKILSVEADNCTVNMEKIYAQFDLVLESTGDVVFNANDYRSASGLNIHAKTLDFTLFSGYVHSLSLTAGEMQADAQELFFDTALLDAQSGDIRIHTTSPLVRFNYDIRGSGSFLLDDETAALPYIKQPAEGDADALFTADLGNASLNLSGLKE